MKLDKLVSSRIPRGVISIIIALTIVLQSCTSSPQRNAVPVEQIELAAVPGGAVSAYVG